MFKNNCVQYPFALLVMVFSSFVFAWQPDDEFSLCAWYSAGQGITLQSGTNEVMLWQDISGNGFNVPSSLEYGVTARPQLKTETFGNGEHPVIDLAPNGNMSFFKQNIFYNSRLHQASQLTVFVVAKSRGNFPSRDEHMTLVSFMESLGGFRMEIQQNSRNYRPRLLMAYPAGFQEYQTGISNSWDYFTGTYNASDGGIRFFVNGVESNRDAVTGGGYSPNPQKQCLTIGGTPGVSLLQPFNGCIAEIVIFDSNNDSLLKKMNEYIKRKYFWVSYMTLFNNDTTNMISSPYNVPGATVGDMLTHLVDETGGIGVDVHLLSPGFGWVPWWQSEVIPESQYWSWCKQIWPTLEIDPWTAYIHAGGDIVQLFIDRCRANDIAPFISYRLNDYHTHPPGKNIRGSNYKCQFHYEHPEYMIGTDTTIWYNRVHNWIYAEAREYKVSLIEEICRKYDIDGLELDFMRQPSFFKMSETTEQQRKDIMLQFVQTIRTMLDQYAPPGKKRYLCVRIPGKIADHQEIGVDVKAFVEAGVDMVNVSKYYMTDQQTDLAEIVKMIPKTPVYLEMHFVTGTGIEPEDIDSSLRTRYTSPEQYYTTANLAYNQGAAGVSIFNFVYTRLWCGDMPYSRRQEPAFFIFEWLKDIDWLEKPTQWYFLDSPLALPVIVSPGDTVTFDPTWIPSEYQENNGIFRIKTGISDFDNSTWLIKLNGVQLPVIACDNRHPIEHYHENFPVGNPSSWHCYACPRSAVAYGVNNLEIKMLTGNTLKLEYIDLVLPGKPAYCGSSGSILPGDLNGNCRVNINDLAILLENWLLCRSPHSD